MVLDTGEGRRDLLSRITLITDARGQKVGYARFSRDITHEKQAEAQLLRQQHALATTEERQRLARDLHDSVAQSIHSQVLFSETLIAALEKNKPDRARALAARLQDSARQTIKEMRLMLYQMRLSDRGDAPLDLPQALEARLQAVERRSGVEAVLQVEGAPPLDEIRSENLYWLAMEALNNALKYAQAGRVRVDLTGDAGRLVLEIADDGRGFDPEQVRAGGLGLESMRARAAKLGGELTIESSPGAGARVRFTGFYPA